MTSSRRVYLRDFALPRAVYSTATVAIFEADPATLAITATLATLYADRYGDRTLANPQILDGSGKWIAPVYVEAPVIMRTFRTLLQT